MLKTILIGLTACYPVIAYLGLKYFTLTSVIWFLILLITFRLLTIRNKSLFAKYKYLLLLIVVILAFIVFKTKLKGDLFIRLYPVFVNMGFLIIFSVSLIFPPTIIEKIALLSKSSLNKKEQAYTRKVTILWCIFFIINLSISSYTVFFSSMEYWTIYNGFISYIIMGTLFISELIYRKWKIELD